MNRTRYITILISTVMIFIISFVQEGYSQPRLEWVSNYISDTAQFHFAIDMARDSSGNTYILGAESNYAILIKINPSGNIEWKRQHLTQGQNNVKNVFVDKSGNINIYFYSDGLYFIKYRADGDSITGKKLNILFNTFSGTNLKVNDNEEVIIGGTFTNIASIKTYIIIKLDINFNLIWEYRESYPLSELNNAEILDLNFDSQNNVYFCGNDALFSIGDTSHSFLTKIKKSGIFEWRKDYAPPHTQTYSHRILIDSNDFIYIAGSLYFIPEQGARSLLLKYNTTGNLILSKYYPDSHITGTDFYTRDVKFDNDENIIVAGVFFSQGTNGDDYKLIKYSKEGKVLWTKIYEGEYTAEYLTSIAIDNENNIYATGHQSTFIDTRVYTVKTSSSGQNIWELKYISPNFKGRGRGLGKKIIVDKYYDIFIACEGQIVDLTGDIYCLKYSQLSNTYFNNEKIKNFELLQNYPNPFNPETNIVFHIGNSGNYEIKVFDISGKLIEVILNKNLTTGIYNINWNAKSHPSGIYFYGLYKDGEKLDMKKMILIK